MTQFQIVLTGTVEKADVLADVAQKAADVVAAQALQFGGETKSGANGRMLDVVPLKPSIKTLGEVKAEAAATKAAADKAAADAAEEAAIAEIRAAEQAAKDAEAVPQPLLDAPLTAVTEEVLAGEPEVAPASVDAPVAAAVPVGDATSDDGA